MSAYRTNRTILRTIKTPLEKVNLGRLARLFYTLLSPILLLVEDILFAGYMSKSVVAFRKIQNKSLDTMTKDEKSHIYNYYNTRALKDAKALRTLAIEASIQLSYQNVRVAYEFFSQPAAELLPSSLPDQIISKSSWWIFLLVIRVFGVVSSAASTFYPIIKRDVFLSTYHDGKPGHLGKHVASILAVIIFIISSSLMSFAVSRMTPFCNLILTRSGRLSLFRRHWPRLVILSV